MNELLHTISSVSDLRNLEKQQLPQLARELRTFIIEVVSTKEGHLGASLGVVELTIALHYVLNTPDDKLVWDVGHQAYGHKILTGRREVFETNRQFGGISGFPKRSESEFDTFGTGHSSTSISAALGMAIASKLRGKLNRQHVAVIGDASIASGMAFEGLNHAGVSDTNILVILNDNSIGIDPSVGALKEYFNKVKNGHLHQDTIFEALNFNYTGPIDGHDIFLLISEIKRLVKLNGPKLLHIVTTKGKGLKQAEQDQVKYHAPGRFNAETGELHSKTEGLPSKFQDVFGQTLVELARENENIVAITPAMPTGSSLTYMMEEFPKRAFDVGIAEQHAVTFAAGLCTQGLTVYCVIYSTFLQRAYDQLIHDVALQNLPVIFCIDRAGLVGEDGATHHGVFDIPYLRCIPNLKICAPRNEIELRNLLFTVQDNLDSPIAIRYPRGRGCLREWQQPFEKVDLGKGVTLKDGDKIAILTVGFVAENAKSAISKHKNPNDIAHYDMRFIKPLDEDLLNQIFTKYRHIITIEDGAKIGGFGSAILEFANRQGYQNAIRIMGIDDRFIEHGNVATLHKEAGIDEISISKVIDEMLS